MSLIRLIDCPSYEDCSGHLITSQDSVELTYPWCGVFVCMLQKSSQIICAIPEQKRCQLKFSCHALNAQQPTMTLESRAAPTKSPGL